jgi:hypothetical protein
VKTKVKSNSLNSLKSFSLEMGLKEYKFFKKEKEKKTSYQKWKESHGQSKYFVLCKPQYDLSSRYQTSRDTVGIT